MNSCHCICLYLSFYLYFHLSYQRPAATVPLPPRAVSSTHAKLNQFQLAQLELLVQYFLTLLQILTVINDYMTKARVFVLILVRGGNINFMVWESSEVRITEVEGRADNQTVEQPDSCLFIKSLRLSMRDSSGHGMRYVLTTRKIIFGALGLQMVHC